MSGNSNLERCMTWNCLTIQNNLDASVITGLVCGSLAVHCQARLLVFSRYAVPMQGQKLASAVVTRADLKTSLFKTHYPLVINARLFPSTSKITIEDPVTESPICTVAESRPEAVQAAIESGRRAFKSGYWSKADVTTKYRVMTKLAYALQDNMESFALKESIQTGRGIREMRAQLARLPEWIEYFASLMRTAEGSTPPFKVHYTYSNYELHFILLGNVRGKWLISCNALHSESLVK